MERPEPLRLARREFLVHTSDATEALGAAVARAIEDDPELARRGLAISLEGELGTGKTAFARGIARGLGTTDAVHSPSFTLMHTYAARLPIYHFDAWMEGREKAFLEGGGAEWLEGGGVALVEWGSRVEPWLPLPRLRVVLEHMGPRDPETRRLALEALGSQARERGAGEHGARAPDPRAAALAALVRDLDVRSPFPAGSPEPDARASIQECG